MLGLRIVPSSDDACIVELAKEFVERPFRHLHAGVDVVAAFHQYFGLDDGHQAAFLAERGITCERMGIGMDGIVLGNP